MSRKAVLQSGELTTMCLEEKVADTWGLPGGEEGNLGSRSPGNAGCSLAGCSGVCAGWTHY